MHLFTVADATVILSPSCFLSIAEEVRPGDVVVMPQLAAPQARVEGLRPVGAGAVEAVANLMVDPLHREPGVQLVPGRALVGVEHGALGDPLADHRHGGRLGRDHLHQGPTVALAHYDDDLALVRLVLGKAPVDPVGGQVLRSDVAAEIGAVDLGDPPFAADAQRLHAGGHRLAQLVRQHEGRLILDIELTAERQHALALHLIAKGSDGQQIGPQRQLVPGEQGARSDREITTTRLAAPAQVVRRSRTGIADHAAAARTHRLAIGLGPAQAEKHVRDPAVGHPHDLRRAERAGRRRKKKMLRHDAPP